MVIFIRVEFFFSIFLLKLSEIFHCDKMSMNPNYLKQNELAYEIAIRGIEVPSSVEDKRKIFRGLLSQESSDRSFTSLSDPFSFEENVTGIRETLSDLKDVCAQFDSKSTQVDHNRILARLTHVSGRIQRLSVDTDDQSATRQSLYREVLMLESDIAEKVSGPVSGPVDVTPTTSTPVKSTGLHSVPSPVSVGKISKCVPVYKWGLKKFSGKESLIPFLELVESLKVSRGCTDSDLFESAGDLFENEAWTWWHNNHIKNRFTNWDELVNALKSTFLHSNYDSVLLQEIKSRKQNLRESVALYISFMEAQFYRLTKCPAESEMVNIIRNNLLPDYVKALVLQDIGTVSQLTALCRRIEDALCLSVSNQLGELQVSETRLDVRCWNCGEANHHYNKCCKPRTRFCFGCGRKGEIKSSCSFCSKNVKGGHNPAGIGGPSGRKPAQNQKKSNQKKN